MSGVLTPWSVCLPVLRRFCPNAHVWFLLWCVIVALCSYGCSLLSIIMNNVKGLLAISFPDHGVGFSESFPQLKCFAMFKLVTSALSQQTRTSCNYRCHIFGIWLTTGPCLTSKVGLNSYTFSSYFVWCFFFLSICKVWFLCGFVKAVWPFTESWCGLFSSQL